MMFSTQGLSLTRIRGDLFGGLTAGVVALPLALAFGVASGAGAAAGLYGAITLGLIAAIFGGTRMQISGPTGPMAVVFASTLTVVGGQIHLAMAAVLVGGVIQMLLGAFKAGGLVRFIPYPVLSGFMSGIGIIIILLQIPPLLGAPPVSAPLLALQQLPAALSAANLQTVLLTVLTLIIVFRTPMSISRVVPSPLVALCLMTVLAVTAGFEVPVIGEIPMGLPEFVTPAFSLQTWATVIVLGATLALLGSIDSLLTSLVADSVTRTRHQPNRELFGQGLGNMLCAFVGGLPGAGATMRTVVNIKAGGRDRISGVVHALFLLLLLIGAAPLATNIPLAVLAGILIKVGVDILDYRILKLLRTAPRTDITVMAAVFGLTVFVDLIVAVGAGVVMSMGLIIHQLTRQANFRVCPLEEKYKGSGMLDGDVRLLEVDGPFFFGSTSRLLDRVDQVMGTRAVVIDCRRVPFMDLSAQFALEDMIERLKSLNIPVVVVVQGDIRKELEKLNAPHLPPELLHETLDDALLVARRALAV
ncbi:SulP family inorganic anion transporter [Geoalkalibacter halelectricus]|uniref:SulP family inorganic anion transporter n=1 Tax=Geoalkalibacter halelectricus TaxID=2847045 RepID=A0ABY5ZJX6_9BACT|nr:SulP family inorganic anion transporter [Geoalkalibacter halelectricus]MDO3377222.1 SulP family inorganic anion transporter [Geoalkalibacter halelectricus]UWZ79353.1 SulP family inorganic anion transporter [Geoalkalibacter halelectricus]